MKSRMILACLALAALTALAASPPLPQSGAADLRLTIQMDKASYRLGEPVTCRVLLENASNKQLIVNHRLLVYVANGPHELVFEIVGPDGRAVPFEKKIRASFESSEYLLLLPNRIVGLHYDLAADHELKMRGSYFVRAHYENRYDPPKERDLPPAWKGTVESNRATFTLE